MVATQLSFLAEVPPRTLVHRGTRPALRPAIERVLVVLAPELPSNMLPRFHRVCVEIPVTKGHRLEKVLRQVGFKVHPKPLDPTAALDAGTGPAWRYWQLAVGDVEEAAE
jgi:hypothetical protein